MKTYDEEQFEQLHYSEEPRKNRPRHNHKDEADYEDRTALDCTGDPGMTLQEPAEDADINVLMKRMGVKDGSALPYFANPRALYGDLSEMPDDPVELAEIMRQGELAFMRIPASVRQRYRNPEELFAWMNDDSNYEEAVKLGLLERKETHEVSPSTSSVKETLVPPSSTSSTSPGGSTE